MIKKVSIDIFFSMIANILPIFILQFLILPQVAIRTNPNDYGLILTIMSFIYFSSSSFGSVLNNSRLINHEKYERLENTGDYNIFLTISILANTLISIVGFLYIGKSINYLMRISLIIISNIALFNTYVSVDFRLKLNYRKILVSSIVLVIGHLIGFVIFVITRFWTLIFLVGYGLNFLYIIFHTSLIREGLDKSSEFNKSLSQLMYLIGAGTLISLGAYADKIILFPLLGGTAVTIYYITTLLGKTLAAAIGPIAGVILSYLAQMRKFNIKRFNIALLFSVLFGSLSYFILIYISEPFLLYLYPKYAIDVKGYIPASTLTIIVTIICNFINPILLKFSEAKWQLVINSIYIVTYVLFSVILLRKYALMGFIIGILISSIIKLILMILAFYFTANEFDDMANN